LTRRLAYLRGVSTLTGFALAVEIGDWDRFTGASIGAYLGLVPSEYSSGTSRAHGAITKTGNTHVRRLLVEAAWHHRRPTGPERYSGTGGIRPRPRPVPVPMPATSACMPAGSG
jgi:transposase